MIETHVSVAESVSAPPNSAAASEIGAESPSTHDVACLYCDGREFVPLYRGVRDRLRHVPGEWAFDRCVECGSTMLLPRPAAEDLADFYPPIYTFSTDLARQGMLKKWLSRLEYRFFFRPQYRAQVAQVLKVCRPPMVTQPKMLDVGCGRGLRLLEFQRRGLSVQGLDLQPEAVEYLRREHGIEALCGQVGDVKRAFGQEGYDIITAYYLLEHIPDVDTVMRDCRDLLKPGGWFVGGVPLFDGLQPRLFGRRWINVTEAPRHLSLPTQRGMQSAFERAGYDEIRLVPDSVLNCCGMIGLSLFPGTDLTQTYGGGSLGRIVARVFSGALSVASVPLCWLENHVLRMPPMGVYFARRPVES